MTDEELAEKALDCFADHAPVVDVAPAQPPAFAAGTALASKEFVQITITCYRVGHDKQQNLDFGAYQVSFTREELAYVEVALGYQLENDDGSVWPTKPKGERALEKVLDAWEAGPARPAQ